MHLKYVIKTGYIICTHISRVDIIYSICDRLCKNRPCSHLVVIRETAV